MPRVLLVLPSATYRAGEFLAAASRLGLDVVTGSDAPQSMAGPRPDRFLVLPLDDPAKAADVVADFAESVPLDAVVAVDDESLLAATAAAERLGIGKNPYDAVAATRDKATMRKLLERAGVPQPRYAVIPTGIDEPDAVAKAASEIGYPAVVKPTALAASRGVVRVDGHESAVSAARQVREIASAAGCPASQPLVVEEFVPGDEVAVEGLLTDGNLEVLAVFDKPDPLDGPYFEETIYVTPSRHPVALLDTLAETISRACAAIGLVDGPVHAEARLSPAADDPSARVVVLEAAARTIGGKCAKALRFAAGRSLEEIVLAHAVGIAGPAPSREKAASGVMMLPVPASGVFAGIDGAEVALDVVGVTALEVTVPVGRALQAWPAGDRYLGFLFARAEDPEQVELALRVGYSRLDIRIDANPPAAAP